MPLSQTRIRKLVSSPSVGALAYQAHRLLQELSRIHDEEFPPQTCKLRDVFLCFADFALEQTWDLYDPKNPLVPKGGAEGIARLHSLAKLTHELYSYVRYLLASSPRQTPPSLQLALTELTNLYFPRRARESEPLCLVRPQWKYNLKYVQLTRQLSNIVSTSVFDPKGVLKSRWKHFSVNKEDPPEHIGVLSFAGLDTNDVLCYPLLAHELGHFIDYTRNPRLYEDPRIKKTAVIRYEDVENNLRRYSTRDPDATEINYWKKQVVSLTLKCLRELLADLLATRMMGFAFFAAQSEFLKTLFSPTDPRITKSGYPGFKFRLWSVLRHLLAMSARTNPKVFLEKHAKSNTDARSLLGYLDEWADRLEAHSDTPPESIQGSGSGAPNDMYKLAEQAVVNSLGVLDQIAKDLVSEDDCPPLTPQFFDRIIRMKHELPPSSANEGRYAFSEIMSSAWAYQVLYGEELEGRLQDPKKRFEEYEKICRIILKAIELIPVSRSDGHLEHSSKKSREPKTRGWLKERGVLSDSHIHRRIQLPITDPAYLAIMPLGENAINGASIDVHLGNWFAYARRTKLGKVKLGDASEEKLLMTIGRDEAYVPIDKTFLLHPGDLVLGITLEFLGLPNDVMAFVEGRSGLGRLGLFVATATQVAPGYHGAIVLELANAGTVPLELKPGMAIAQLVLQVMTNKATPYVGKYQCQIKP